ncbi:DUF2316 family protein [Lacticaseibacillus brantae]|uniref:DUF2316 domain-containing protein n=1 Tax=Lacticaseibacillus brantae DSM 23927 TaxID=1423727 RepID=A0A0R2B177_9LACO|nr:DUF2316 family protein [Lacticaseibacillus brantae]KRM72975.1 hypothetical protein FC34_GL000689 [Lacticaseibacillus brantae DSM 23927]
MTLNQQQLDNTRHELQANFELTGLTKAQVATDLGISEVKLAHLFDLTQQSLSDPWILRNYLLEKVQANGQNPIAFTALSGDWHRHWFLDTQAIDDAQMSAGDN